MDRESLGLENLDEFEASLVPDDELDEALVEDDSAAEPGAEPINLTSQGDSEIASDSQPSADSAFKVKRLTEPKRWVGKRLSHFRLMRMMGSGTMGVVFQVEDVTLKRIAALKVLRRQIKGADRAQLVERFLLEARTAAAIDHPSIAQVYEIGEFEGWWCIAMEYLEGGSLADIVKATGPLAPGKAAMMLADAARGLAAAHEESVIHRDIKPANLMLSRRGRCKIVDFGLVKLDSAENPFRDDDKVVVGTPLYVAPEICVGRGASKPSDVYSLAATLYALLAGQPPFVAENAREVLKKHVSAPPPDLREVAPHCSDGLASLIQRSMSKQAKKRPTAEEFAVALQSEVTGALALETASGSPMPPVGAGSGATVLVERTPAMGGGGSSDVRSAVSSTVVMPETVVSSGGSLRWMWGLAAVIAVGVGVWSLNSPLIGTNSEAERGPSITNSIGMTLESIPAGDFVMGSPATEEGRNIDERAVKVTLTQGYYLSRTEVTQQQWASVMGDDYLPPEGVHPNEESGRRFLGNDLPAYVAWVEAAEFCRVLSEREGKLYRLPTEAEWEYACRAGTSSAFNTGTDLSLSQANIDAEQDGSTKLRPKRHPLPVASFAPNTWGLYDMHGNVMEWCQDGKASYPVGPQINPVGASDEDLRVLRGGSWDSPARVARSANRWFNPPEVRADYIGFRVVLEPDLQPPAGVASYLSQPLSSGDAGSAASLEDQAVPAKVSVDPALPSYMARIVLDHRLRSRGSDTMNQLMELWENSFQRWHKHIAFRHEGKGSGTAVPALAEGLSHFGPMSRSLSNAESRDFSSEYGYEPTQLKVAIDALAVYVHPSNPIAARGLTLAELDAIYSTSRKRGFAGLVRVWGDLGLTGEWAEAPIKVYSRNPASGTYSVFRRMVLDGGVYKPGNQELVSSTVVVQAVARDRYGIGFSGIGFKQPGVVTVPLALRAGDPVVAPLPETANDGSYSLARWLYLAIDHPPGEGLSGLQREFLRFVYSREGQQIVTEAGFFPLTAVMAAQELSVVGLPLSEPASQSRR